MTEPASHTLAYLRRLDEKLDRIEGRFDVVDGRLERVEGRLGRIEEELLVLNGLDRYERRLAELAGRITKREGPP